jgi:two-component system, LuxR family, sensor kinase FixL
MVAQMEPHQKGRGAKERLLAATFALLLLVGGGSLWAQDGAPTNSASQPSESARNSATPGSAFDWNRRTIFVLGAGGLVLCVGTGVAWRGLRSRRGRFSTQQQAAQEVRKTDALRSNQIALEEARMESQRQLEARRQADEQIKRLREESEQRISEATAELSRKCQELQQELDTRKRAEKDLVVQRQELVRSKDVLGMHVQARTQEIQKLKGRYEQVLNSAGEGIYGLDQNGKTTFVNPAAAKLTGWSVEEMVGKLEMDIFQRQVPDGPANGAANGHTEVNGSEENVLAEHIFRRRDGTSFPVEYHRTPIMETNRMVGAVIIFRDITERKRAEESISRKAAELARSNAELEQFAYVASHDLQEPLRKIQAFGGRLKTKVEAAKIEDGRDYLDRMLNAAARMQRLISDLLTFSRVLSSSKPFVQVDLGDLVREVLSDMEVTIEQSKAKVEFEGLPMIEGDPTQLRQILQNLISNSIKFQPPGQAPEVRIEAQVLTRPFSCVKHPTPDDQVCELSLKDNGIGFDEKYLDKVFAVFQRLHGRSEYDGTGVGLAVCRRIVDRHGGTITAKSKLGEGATFVVALPVRQNNVETTHEP